mmetsp:Transcript_20398/g.40764  ORF Transcript_20398/g.40764 Transcript_20398/m.40764 type:complete len:402 (+) Transcript_20398:219-1424(+)
MCAGCRASARACSCGGRGAKKKNAVGSPPRAVPHREGAERHRRTPDDTRRPGAHARSARRRHGLFGAAPGTCGSDRVRQEQRAPQLRGRPDLQCAPRHVQQPVGRVAHGRRLLGRIGGRAGGPSDPARAGIRHRRIDPRSRGPLRSLRTEDDVRYPAPPRRDLRRAARPRSRSVGARTHGADGGRSGAPAHGADQRPAPACRFLAAAAAATGAGQDAVPRCVSGRRVAVGATARAHRRGGGRCRAKSGGCAHGRRCTCRRSGASGVRSVSQPQGLPAAARCRADGPDARVHTAGVGTTGRRGRATSVGARRERRAAGAGLAHPERLAARRGGPTAARTARGLAALLPRGRVGRGADARLPATGHRARPPRRPAAAAGHLGRAVLAPGSADAGGGRHTHSLL